MTETADPKRARELAHKASVFHGRMSHRDDARQLFEDVSISLRLLAQEVETLRKEREKLVLEVQVRDEACRIFSKHEEEIWKPLLDAVVADSPNLVFYVVKASAVVKGE